jgi:hypothetical protein
MIKSDMQLKINKYRDLIKYSDLLLGLSLEVIFEIAELYTDKKSEEYKKVEKIITKMVNEKKRLEVEYEHNTGTKLLREIKKARYNGE